MRNLLYIFALILLALQLQSCTFNKEKEIKVSIIDKTIFTPLVYMKYPKISGMSNKSLQNKINYLIQSKVLEHKNRHEILHPRKSTSKYKLKYELTCHKNSFLSFIFNKGDDTDNYMETVMSFTINLRNGSIYNFKDIFTKEYDFTAVIKQKAAEFLEAENPHYVHLIDKIDLEQNFYITNDSLVLYFPNQRISTENTASIKVNLKYSDIPDTLNKEFRVFNDNEKVKTENPNYIYFNAYTKAFSSIVQNSSDRIWQGYNIKNIKVVLFNKKEKIAVTWSRNNFNDSENINKLSYKKIPDNIIEANSGFKVIKGVITFFTHIPFDKKLINNNLEMIFSRLFEYTVQNKWAIKVVDENIFENISEDWQPRYYRRQVIRSLLNSFQNQNSYKLGEAVYWYKRYKTEYPAEIEAVELLDIISGINKYAGMYSAALGIYGVSSYARNDRILYLQKLMKNLWAAKWSKMSDIKNIIYSESEAIGVISAFMLDIMGATYWKHKVADGVSPVDIIMEHITATQELDDEELIKSFKNWQQNYLLTDDVIGDGY